jgi:hypothetical protein
MAEPPTPPVNFMKNSRLPLLVVVVLLLHGCGALDGPMTSNVTDDLTAQNGLANNGLANNGLANNGLANNGLANNGLANDGLATTAFSTWFGNDVAYANMVMTYLVRCAHPNGSSLSYTYKSKTYTWYGLLGLAPGWSSGKPATEPEQQVITACMASLANKFAKSVPISLQGRSVTGAAIPVGATEFTDYPVREGCFFGNFFSNEGVFAGLDHTPYNDQYSTARACAFDKQLDGSSVACPPIYQTGFCKSVCVPDATGSFWETCTWNEKIFRTITTRLQNSSIYKCGDGVCQFTESCGMGNTFDSCLADCGACK